MKLSWLLLPLAAACAPRPEATPPSIATRWVTLERDAARLDYPAGDGSVSDTAKVLILAPAPASARGRRPPPLLRLPGRVEVGEIFRIEIRVPRAEEDERRTFRIRCGRPGLRLLDGDVAVTTGRRGTERRAVAESAGPASFDLEELAD